MDEEQFQAAVGEVIVATNSRYRIPFLPEGLCGPRPRETEEEGEQEWFKSHTPHRVTFTSPWSSKPNKRSTHVCLQMADRNIPDQHSGDLWRFLASHQRLRAPQGKGRREEGWLTMLPLPTLIVKHQLSFRVPPYTLSQLRLLLSRFGRIKSIARLQANSAVVVFRDLMSARRAFLASPLGAPPCRLSCQWLYPALAQPNIYSALQGQPTVQGEQNLY